MAPSPRHVARTACLAALASVATAATTIAISRTSDLSFGAIVAGTSAGTVTMSPQGIRTANGGVTLAGGSAASVSSFVVTGDAFQTFSIVLPASIGISGPSASMTLDQFTSDPDGTAILNAAGSRTLDVGATLHVGASQPSGTYSGTFQVTVAYD